MRKSCAPPYCAEWRPLLRRRWGVMLGAVGEKVKFFHLVTRLQSRLAQSYLPTGPGQPEDSGARPARSTVPRAISQRLYCRPFLKHPSPPSAFRHARAAPKPGDLASAILNPTPPLWRKEGDRKGMFFSSCDVSEILMGAGTCPHRGHHTRTAALCPVCVRGSRARQKPGPEPRRPGF